MPLRAHFDSLVAAVWLCAATVGLAGAPQSTPESSHRLTPESTSTSTPESFFTSTPESSQAAKPSPAAANPISSWTFDSASGVQVHRTGGREVVVR